MRVLENRREETALNGHGDSDVGWLELDDPITGPDRVGVRHRLEGQGAGLDDEVIDAELDATGFELLVGLRTEPEEFVQHDVSAKVEMRDCLLGLAKSRGNHLAHSVERDFLEFPDPRTSP